MHVIYKKINKKTCSVKEQVFKYLNLLFIRICYANYLIKLTPSTIAQAPGVKTAPVVVVLVV